MTDPTGDESIQRFGLMIQRAEEAKAELLKKLPVNKAVIEARRRLIAAAEKTLKRPLTKLERSSFSGYDLTPALHFEQHCLLEPADEVEKYIRESVQTIGKARIIDTLGRSTKDLQTDFQKLLDILEPEAAKTFATVNFAVEAKAFAKWFSAVFKNNPPPPETKVCYIQLGEYDDGCRLLLCGARSTSALSHKCNWTEPSNHPLTANNRKLWKALDRPGSEPWWVMLALAIILARDFFRTNGTKLLRRNENSDLRMTIGFPEGDLHKIKTN